MDDPSKTSIAVRGKVHQAGGGTIQEMRQDGVVVFSAKGKCSPELLEAFEALVLRCPRDVGLDFRNLQDPDPNIIPMLRRLSRRFDSKKRVLLLYAPPSRLLDLLRLRGALDDFSIYDPDKGISAKEESPRERSSDKSAQHKSSEVHDTIVHFTHDLDRAKELETSLDVAGRRAGRMLAKWTPEFPPYDIATTYLPHDKVGGDFFQLIPLSETRLGIGIGDVSGHGIEAALLMGMARKVMEIRATDGSIDDPTEILAQVNVDLYSDLDRFTFITALYGILDRDTGRFCYGRAGHNYPVLVSKRSGKAQELPGSGIAFGIDGGTLFQQAMKMQEVILEPGDLLIFYTDGVTEAAHPRRGQLGLDRLMHLLEQLDLSRPVSETKDIIFQEVSKFLDGNPLADDLTLICVQRPA